MRANAEEARACTSDTAPEPAAKSGSITFSCGKCGKKMIVRPELKGKKIRCRSCNEITEVTDSDAEPKPSAETVPPPVPPEPPKDDEPPDKDGPEESEQKEEEDNKEPPPAALASEPTPAPAVAEKPKVDENRIAALEKELELLKERVATLTRLLSKYAASNADAASTLADGLKD